MKRDVVAEFGAECDALDAMLVSLADKDWDTVTQFFDWTVRDEVMHLLLCDEFGLVSVETPEAFPPLVAEIRAGQARGYELSNRMRDQYGHLTAASLLERWRETWRRLRDRLAEAEPDRRLPWFGPEMSVLSFAAARQMEVWAHGQDIYDVMRSPRRNEDRVWNICDLGVRTMGWTFRNRGLEKPDVPLVRLIAPSNAEWLWNERGIGEIAGPAEDFALVVTQRRHVDDTRLTMDGAAARQWMEIAQCFAGPPADGPAAGSRPAFLEP